MGSQTAREMLLRISDIRRESPDINTIRLEFGEEPPFSFRPGQFVIIKADRWNPRRNRVMPVKRAFSISSSPTETGFIEIAVKRVPTGRLSPWLHDEVKPGDFLNVKGPEGTFVLNSEDCETIVFIAGGVGIAPLRSMIRYLVDRKEPVGIRLFYSARKPADFSFKQEFDRQAASHPDMLCFYTLTRLDQEAWTGRTGRFDRRFLEVHLEKNARYYLCGPPAMVREIRQNLKDLAVSESGIAVEMW
ncbi:MAG TPA: FAD-binding oxidoreductase [Nitrospiria bacterium]|nr:FAD-binding oxidoreductase [Nitrospiria bacterium]